MVLLAIAAGFVAGPERGAIVGLRRRAWPSTWCCSTPFGLSALVYTFVGYVVGVVGRQRHPRPSWWITPVAGGAGLGAPAMVAYALVGEVLGQATLRAHPSPLSSWSSRLLNAVLAPLAVRAMRWTLADDVDRRRTAHFLPR